MKLFKNGTIILIIGVIGVMAIVGFELYIQHIGEPKAYTAQEIAGMDIQRLAINTASYDELASSPLLTPELANNIVHYREEYGGFSTVEELLNVKGIGQKTYERIQFFVTLD